MCSSIIAPILDVSAVTLHLGDRLILDDIDFRLASGESMSIMGRSGSGKSSLLSCILGLLRPGSGEIRVGGVRVESQRGKALARLRREKIGMIFQGGELLPELSAFDNVLIAGLLGGQTVGEATKRAGQLLDYLSVLRPERDIGDYSGGERQRVAVARALVNQPELLLADEPTASLDTDTRDDVLALFRSLPDQFKCALLIVTHDPVVAATCGRQAILSDAVLHESTLAWSSK